MGDKTWSRWMVTFLLTVAFLLHTSYGKEKMDIQSMHIDTKVTSRFARTLITMVVQNPSNSSQEAIFDVELPKTAFITNFSMTIDNVTNVGTVKEKAEAKRQYQKAVSKGQSAGLVQSIGRKMENFKISVNVGSLAKATFKLTYEELLKRQLGIYELNIRVRPQELVENFQITVDIIEPQGISFLKAAGTFTSNEVMDIVKINRTESKAHIEFSPTVDQQRRCPGCLETVLDGDLTIKYDVKRDNSAGKLQVVNGYFVHYFAPPSLSRIPKNVVFVIDHSGSMYGTKIKQTYEAFIKILGDVPIEDHFGLLMFDDKVDKWKKTLVKATPDNINKAKEFVSHMTARGGTDINKALLSAAKMLTNATINNMLPKVSASIIIFLSDGEPTSGTTDHKKIIDNVKRFLEGQASLYCLGFGKDVDYNFLERLALENGGLARRIYEDSDSALQLQGFYNEVAYPMLLDVNLQYLENSVDYVTQNSFKHYYQGSEIIVAGHVTDNNLDVLTAEVTAKGMSEPFSIKVEANLKEEEDVEKEQQYIFGDFTERLWAYLSIEQLLIQQISLDGENKQRVKEKALNLSLQYHFVTPLTSMVVTTDEEKEDADKRLVANKPKEGGQAIGEDFPADYDNDKMLDTHYYVDYDAEEEEVLASRKIPLMAKVEEVHAFIAGHYPVPYTEVEEIQVLHEIPLIAGHYPVPHTAMPRPETTTPKPQQPMPRPETTTPKPQQLCLPFLILLRTPQLSQRICLRFSKDNEGYINLFHDDATGITLNAKLGNDKSIERFGFLNSKLGVKAEIVDDNVTITHGSNMEAYSWDSSFQRDGFLKKEGEKITAELQDGISFTIFRVEQQLHLSLYVEDQHVPSNNNRGIIGHLVNNETSYSYSVLSAGYQKFLMLSFTGCDLSPFGAKDLTSCQFLIFNINTFIGGGNFVSDIFTVPQHDTA